MAQPTVTDNATTVSVQAESMPTGLAALGVNPTLLAVQVVNFLLLLLVLRWVLYKPVLELLQKRRAAIAQGVADAERASQVAASAEAQASQLLAKARTEAKQIVDEAHAAADTVGSELRAEASREAGQLLERTRNQLEQEKSAIISAAERELGSLVIRATERVIGKQSLSLDPNEVAAALNDARSAK